jgi:hypothetical protein
VLSMNSGCVVMAGSIRSKAHHTIAAVSRIAHTPGDAVIKFVAGFDEANMHPTATAGQFVASSDNLMDRVRRAESPPRPNEHFGAEHSTRVSCVVQSCGYHTTNWDSQKLALPSLRPPGGFGGTSPRLSRRIAAAALAVAPTRGSAPSGSPHLDRPVWIAGMGWRVQMTMLVGGRRRHVYRRRPEPSRTSPRL